MRKKICAIATWIVIASTSAFGVSPKVATSDEFVESILKKMTLQEKIGQLNQMHYQDGEHLIENARKGLVGTVMSFTNPSEFNKLQEVAVNESRLGIPLINARDVIHGFKTIFPIPLGQACSFDPELIEQGARISAIEASAAGIRWTFAPMVDISQDPRWGRIAEGFGEDPYLASVLGSSMVKGFQGKKLSDGTSIAACAKHFAGYGASESGKDYNSTFIAPNRFRNLYLRPFHACVDNGVATIMTSFNDNDGIPSTANSWLLKDVLRGEWGFKGVVVTDWNAINEMINHGFCEDSESATLKAFNATIDIDMMSNAFINYLTYLIKHGHVDEKQLDNAVRRVLRLKYDLGLFENPYCNELHYQTAFYKAAHLAKAQELAEKSIVLLKNESKILPLDKKIRKILVTGPLADAPHDQLGTWVFDGEASQSITPLAAIIKEFGNENVIYEPGLNYSRDKNINRLEDIKLAALAVDAIIVFVGEESILSGEAHSLTSPTLQGAQSQLIKELSQLGKPLVTIVIAGRPLIIGNDISHSSAVLYSFAPGTMGGPAITNTLVGKNNPSGKLPVTFPKMIGQIPMYYNHNNTGRPATGMELKLDDIPVGSEQTSLGNKSYFLDHPDCLFPFGFGLSYSDFKYSNLKIEQNEYSANDSILISFDLANSSNCAGEEIVQIYMRDLHASLTRPVKELIHFERIYLQPNEIHNVSISIPVEKLGFWINDQYIVEPGKFELFVGGNSKDCLNTFITVVN